MLQLDVLLQRTLRTVTALTVLHIASISSLDFLCSPPGPLDSILFRSVLFGGLLFFQVPEFIFDVLDSFFEIVPEINLFIFLHIKMVRNDIDFTVLFVVVKFALIELVETLDVMVVLAEGFGGIVVVLG